MSFPNFFLLIFFTYYVVTLTAVQSYRLIVVPRSQCCSKLGRSAFAPLAAIAEAASSMMQNKPKGTADRLFPEEEPLDADELNLPSVHSPTERNVDENDKAYLCSKLACSPQLFDGPVCACNFKTGSVISFKNKCDLKKHNCRFDTGFKVILGDICPWEFQSRRAGSGGRTFEYDNSKYYN